MVLCVRAGHSDGRCAERPPANSVGQAGRGFPLRDFQGQAAIRSTDFTDKPAVVVAFWAPSVRWPRCMPRGWCNWPSASPSSGVAFVGINSNQQDSLSELAAVRQDARHQVSAAQGRGQHRGRSIRRGAHARGVRARPGPRGPLPRPDRRSVHRRPPAQSSPRAKTWPLALEEVLAGKAVSQPMTEAPGCLIGRVHQPKADAKVTYRQGHRAAA